MKHMKRMTRLLALVLCLVAMLSLLASCRKYGKEPEGTLAPAVDDGTPATVKFTLTVTQKDGTSKDFEVSTDKENVGDALLAAGLITGTTSAEYGLFIQTVNGVAADYEKDKTYWAVYVDGEYSSVGISSVKVRAGMKVELKMEVAQES